ncbi:MAG: DNA-3-methyladenine glycosylase family protein [Anaerolineae bacterium]
MNGAVPDLRQQPGFTLRLDPVAPYRLDLTVWTLRRRDNNRMDLWDGGTYRRTLLVRGNPVTVAVAQTAEGLAPVLEVAVPGLSYTPGLASDLTIALSWMLGVDLDLEPFYSYADGDPELGALTAPFRGFRPARFPTLYEALVNAIACQQISLVVGLAMLNRLCEAVGERPDAPAEAPAAFPEPERVLSLAEQDLRGLGFSGAKARSLLEVSDAVCQRQLRLEELGDLPDAEVAARLRALRGIGPWSADYVLLRGLGRTHVFPRADAGARGNLQRMLGRQTLPESWQPFGGLVYFHLLLRRVAEAGWLAIG